MRRAGLVVALLGLAPSLGALAQERRADREDVREPKVGMVGRLFDVVLPGPELEAAPITSTSPIVLRVTSVAPHGDAFRYDLEFQGLEPGPHDLAGYLRRRDGQPATGLPRVEVFVLDPLLFVDQRPQDLLPGQAPAVGGYRRATALALAVWLAALLVLISGGGRAPPPVAAAGPATTRDRLAGLLAAARGGELSTERQAELERLVIEAWRGRLDLRGLAPHEAMSRLRADAAAGPPLARLEAWLHAPPARRVPLGPADLEALAPRDEAP